MKIIEKKYTLNGNLQKRSKTNMIILHHAVYNGDVEGIDRIHKNNGWTCIGYHFYVRKDGSIYRGRKEDTVGAHAYGSNTTSIGICAEGNFEKDVMSEAQKNSIIELLAYLKYKYKVSTVKRHKDVNATACPGKNYPFDEIVNAKVKNATKEEQKTNNKEEFNMAKTYKNGSTVENVYADTGLTNKIGSLNEWEQCECLDVVNGKYLVKYKVDGTNNYKCGFVKYNGGL